jgi:hypothetical protein
VAEDMPVVRKRGTMDKNQVTSQILKAVQQAPDCTLEELMQNFTDLDWCQVFLEVDRLSRLGQLRLISKGAGCYTVRLRAG